MHLLAPPAIACVRLAAYRDIAFLTRADAFIADSNPSTLEPLTGTGFESSYEYCNGGEIVTKNMLKQAC